MHADRPLISGNRTSSMLHELVHVGTGIRGDKESDWIVEGIAEYYSLQTLLRTGGISQRRFEEALEDLAEWGEESPNLLVKRSSGPITARATVVLHQVDLAIQKSSSGKSSLDNVVTALAAERGEVTLEKFRALAEEAAGAPIPELERTLLTGKKKPWHGGGRASGPRPLGVKLGGFHPYNTLGTRMEEGARPALLNTTWGRCVLASYSQY